MFQKSGKPKFSKVFLFLITAIFFAACSSPVLPSGDTSETLSGSGRAFTSSWTNAYFRGTANSWGTTAMELVGDNLWATTQDFTGDTSPRFKVDRFGDWNENYPTADFTVGQGEYYITFNDQSKVVTAELTENLIWDNAYFRGTPNSWAATPMAQISDFVWETTQDFDGQSNPRFKIDRFGDWAENYPTGDVMVPGGGLKTIQLNTATKAVTVTDAQSGTVATPVLTPAGGIITDTQKISAQTSTSGATIRYTLGGATPTSSSSIFPSEGLSLPLGSQVLKVRAFRSGWTDSAVTTGSYTVEEGQTGTLGSMHPTSGAFSPDTSVSWANANWPLGSHFVNGEGSDLEIAVYGRNATKVLLEVYSTNIGSDAQYDYWMEKGPDNIWRAKLNNVPGKTLYAFRVWGPNWPFDAAWTRGNSSAGFITDVDAAGNRYNPNKVVYDVYAKELSHDKETPEMFAAGENGGMYGTGGTDLDPDFTYTGPITGGVPISRRNVDTGKYAIKSVAFEDFTSYGTKPAIPEKSSVVYEAHARGITRHPSAAQLGDILQGINGFEAVQNVPDAYRGTYKGAGYIAPYLKALGYTAIELLPVHETANDINPDDNSGGNYWGYMTYGFFAPDRRYSYDKSLGGPTAEFKEMVKTFHENGMEVYIDVVYNHTGEGGTWEATGQVAEITGFRGFDNQDYYALVDGARQFFWESAGVGNNMDASTDVVKTLIKDSLRYWITEMGIDGFRFDLTPVLGRDSYPNYYYNPNAQLLVDIADMTTQYNVEMIAEAWDISTYAVGTFPWRWGEWNGRFRDAFRRFMKGDGNTGAFTDHFNGDYWNFNDQGGPQKSVNFIVAHDGFTLADLVSYNTKNNVNVTWPFGPSDGGNDSNEAWDSNGNQALRRQRIRNFYATQFMSRGVPMTVWGDEFARTQNGNNNPYNIDSVATWSNYWMIGSDSPQTVSTGAEGAYHDNIGTDANADGINNIFLFAQYVGQLRANDPTLQQDNYNISYAFHKANGFDLLGGNDRAVWVRIDSSSQGGKDYLVFVNMWTSQVDFRIPTPDPGKQWVRIVDTGSWAEYANNTWDPNDPSAYVPTGFSEYGGTGKSYGVGPWTVAIFREK
jgi:isoamylase